jgi:hypothetical protein
VVKHIDAARRHNDRSNRQRRRDDTASDPNS